MRQLKILIVEDSPTIRMGLVSVLRKFGAEVMQAADGSEGLDIALASQFDLIITDLTMPELTGIELSARLKAIRSDLPVILFSGYSEQFSKEAAVRAGVSQYCTKPFALRELSSVVYRLISLSEADTLP